MLVAACVPCSAAILIAAWFGIGAHDPAFAWIALGWMVTLVLAAGSVVLMIASFFTR